MERSIEYPAWGDGPGANKDGLTRRRRWMRETPVVTEGEGPKIAFRLLLLLAIPAVPGTVWVLQFAAAMAGNTARAPFPQLAILPVLLLACVSAVAAWRARHGRGTA